VPRTARVPHELAAVPFRGTAAVSRGLLTRGMLRGHAWRRLFPDVYVHRAAYDAGDHRMWCAAADLTLPAGGAVDGPSAAYLWGAPSPPGEAPQVTVTVPRAVRLWPHPRRCASRTDLVPGDITVCGGIRVTTPLRTGYDLGCRLGRHEPPTAVEALIRLGVVDVAALRRYAAGQRRRPGTRRLAEVLSRLTDVRVGVS
jgi:hypothetical protein